MCGRYFIDDEMWREIRKICKQIDDAKLKVTVGDVRPTDMAMVLTGMKNVHLEAMRWGFTSKYQDWLLINARAESILSKPAFRNSVRNCRCVIPAAGFYEYYIARSCPYTHLTVLSELLKIGYRDHNWAAPEPGPDIFPLQKQPFPRSEYDISLPE